MRVKRREKMSGFSFLKKRDRKTLIDGKKNERVKSAAYMKMELMQF